MSGIDVGPLALTEPDLERYGRDIGAAALGGGVFVCLCGALGAGKSTLARAACRGAGVTGAVPSPTFTLVNQYEGRGGAIVYHADLYRVDSAEGLLDMGWEALLQADGPVFVEWADRAHGYLPVDRWDIRLDFVDDAALRLVSARVYGAAPPVPQPAAAAEDRLW